MDGKHPEFGWACPSTGVRRSAKIAVSSMAVGLCLGTIAGAAGALMIAGHGSASIARMLETLDQETEARPTSDRVDAISEQGAVTVIACDRSDRRSGCLIPPKVRRVDVPSAPPVDPAPASLPANKADAAASRPSVEPAVPGAIAPQAGPSSPARQRPKRARHSPARPPMDAGDLWRDDLQAQRGYFSYARGRGPQRQLWEWDR